MILKFMIVLILRRSEWRSIKNSRIQKSSQIIYPKVLPKITCQINIAREIIKPDLD